MKICALLLLGLSTSIIGAQEMNLGTLTVGDIQKMYADEDRKALTQDLFITFFNGYMIGIVHGVSFTMFQADLVTEDVTSEIGDCAAVNTQRLFYEMLAVSDARLKLNVAQFAQRAFLDRCLTTIGTILEKELR